MIKSLYYHVNLQYIDRAKYLIHIEEAMNNLVNITTELLSNEVVYSSSLYLFLFP